MRAWLVLPGLCGDGLLDCAEGQAPNQLLLGEPTEDHHRQHRHGPGCRELRPEQPFRRDERDHEHGHGSAPRRHEIDGQEELAPRKDQADEDRRDEPRHDHRDGDLLELLTQVRSIDPRSLHDVRWDLVEERAQEPDRDGQVHRRVHHDQRQQVVDELEVAGDDEDRDDHPDRRQELRREEEEEDVVAPLAATPYEGVRTRNREDDDEDRRDPDRHEGVEEERREPAVEDSPEVLGRRGEREWEAVAERQDTGRKDDRGSLGLERGDDQVQHREEEDEPDGPSDHRPESPGLFDLRPGAHPLGRSPRSNDGRHADAHHWFPRISWPSNRMKLTANRYVTATTITPIAAAWPTSYP